MENKFGDSDFRNFINREYRSDPLELVVSTINSKMNAVINVYSKTLEAYRNLKDEDPLKNDLREHIKQMMAQTLQTMDQFNYALIDDDDEEGEEEEEPDGN